MFVLDRKGMSQIAKSAGVRQAVQKAAGRVAANARQLTDLPVETDNRTTDRAVVDVTIAHPAGAATQAKHGVLTRSASAAGLEVR